MTSMLAGMLIILVGMLAVGRPVQAKVTASEAQKLKTTLTPLGAEKAGNSDGSIPEWEGGLTTVPPGFNPEAKRPDPFADEKPLFSINSQNMGQYSDQLSEGIKAILKKYPNERLDIYKTHRTAAAPQRVYDNTFKNALQAGMADDKPTDLAMGGYPFPIPTNGGEALWNHLLRWDGGSYSQPVEQWFLTPDGKTTLLGKGGGNHLISHPFYDSNLSKEKWDGTYVTMIWQFNAPPVRSGEGIVAKDNIDQDKSACWVYLPGQRRVRQLPNSCCDTPNPSMGGLYTFDDTFVWTGRIDRYDWEIVGKKEVYIPYNENRMFKATDSADLFSPVRTIKPEYRRWELHRVWVVEGTLRQGQRHVVPRLTLYLDEDTWSAVMSDRYDAKGQLWKVSTSHVFVTPEAPCVNSGMGFTVMDLTTDIIFHITPAICQFQNKYLAPEETPASIFSPGGLKAISVR